MNSLPHGRKIYDLIKELLTDYPELRDSDRKLIWTVWSKIGLLNDTKLWENGKLHVYAGTSINYQAFVNSPSTETIRRCRQKIQELHPELQSSKWIRKQRQAIEDQRGTHIYREEISFSESVKEQMKLI
mgnify:CR=1 FL=1